MELGSLSFLAESWFVIPWYAFGFVAAAWVLYDSYYVNRYVNEALK